MALGEVADDDETVFPEFSMTIATNCWVFAWCVRDSPLLKCVEEQCKTRMVMTTVMNWLMTMKSNGLKSGLAKRAELRFPSSGQSRVEAQLGPVLTGPGELRIGLSSFSSFSSGRCSAQIDDSM